MTIQPLTIADFPHTIVERLRYSDADLQGHINNAVFAVLLESGRMDFLYDPAQNLPPEGTQFVIAELTIRFLREMHYPGDITVASGVARLGRSSLGLHQGLFVNEQCVATADSVIVLTDPETRKSTPLPSTARDTLGTLLLPQVAPAQ